MLKAQILAVLLIVTWTAFWTFVLMLIIKHTVGTNVDRKTDRIGLDLVFHDEVAYDSVYDKPEWEKAEEKHIKIGQVKFIMIPDLLNLLCIFRPWTLQKKVDKMG